jgi:hypothetical protein
MGTCTPLTPHAPTNAHTITHASRQTRAYMYAGTKRPAHTHTHTPHTHTHTHPHTIVVPAPFRQLPSVSPLP